MIAQSGFSLEELYGERVERIEFFVGNKVRLWYNNFKIREAFKRMEKDKKTINRCSECGLYKTPQTDICPECGGIMDLAIKGEDLSWSCRQCSYSLATTAQKPCYWDNKKFAKECYPQMEKCPYAEK